MRGRSSAPPQPFGNRSTSVMIHKRDRDLMFFCCDPGEGCSRAAAGEPAQEIVQSGSVRCYSQGFLAPFEAQARAW